MFGGEESEMSSNVEDVEEEDEESANDLSNSDIVTKYRCAGEIANKVLAELIVRLEPGITAVDLCEMGDKCEAHIDTHPVLKRAYSVAPKTSMRPALHALHYPAVVRASSVCRNAGWSLRRLTRCTTRKGAGEGLRKGPPSPLASPSIAVLGTTRHLFLRTMLF